MHYHRIAGQFFSRPLLLTPAAADTIGNVLLTRMRAGPLAGGSGEGDHDARTEKTYFDAQRGADGSVTVHSPAASRFYGETPISEDGTRRPLPFRRTAEGVAIITLVGEWVNRGGYVGASSGVISYEGFKYQIDQAARDPRTRAILLDMESPGGEAVGAFEAAAAVRAVAAVKPVWALVNGLCASAMYAIASGATRIVSIPTGISGSIGVVLCHMDLSAWLKEEGIQPTFIHAGARKVDANPYQPLPEAVRDRLQAEVEDFYALFVETVAAGRSGLTEKAIRETEAGCFMGAEALSLGLVDQLGTFEQTLAELSSMAPQGRNLGALVTMSHATTATAAAALATAGALAPGAAAPALPTAAATLPAVAGVPAAEHAAAVANARSEGETAGRTAERERIGAILGGEHAKGRAGLAMHFAFKTDMAADSANAALAASPAEAPQAAAAAAPGAAFEASLETRTPLNLGPENPAKAAGQAEAWGAIADGIFGAGARTVNKG